MNLVIEIFIDNEWQECALLKIAQTEKSFESQVTVDFELDYFDKYAQFINDNSYYSVSCLIDLNLVRYSFDHWPSFLLDLMPQGAARTIVAKRLKIADLPINDFKILKNGAINPIGHLRVKSENKLFTETNATNFSLDDIALKRENFLEEAHRLGAIVIGGTGAQGVAPKYLINLNKDHHYSIDGALKDELIEKSFIIKLPKSNKKQDIEILHAEKVYMDMAIELGLNAFKNYTLYKDMLLMERFDREYVAHNSIRHGVESLSSLLGDFQFGERHFIEDVFLIIKKYSSQHKLDLIEFLRRDFLNIALGNTDNHARNSAFIKKEDRTIRISPLYDFAPMCLDDEGIIRVIRWKEEDNSIVDFNYLNDFFVNDYGLEKNEVVEILKYILSDLEKIDFLKSTKNLSTSIKEKAWTKKIPLTNKLKDYLKGK